jgi:hypothetical protein
MATRSALTVLDFIQAFQLKNEIRQKNTVISRIYSGILRNNPETRKTDMLDTPSGLSMARLQ